MAEYYLRTGADEGEKNLVMLAMATVEVPRFESFKAVGSHVDDFDYDAYISGEDYSSVLLYSAGHEGSGNFSSYWFYYASTILLRFENLEVDKIHYPMKATLSDELRLYQWSKDEKGFSEVDTDLPDALESSEIGEEAHRLRLAVNSIIEWDDGDRPVLTDDGLELAKKLKITKKNPEGNDFDDEDILREIFTVAPYK